MPLSSSALEPLLRLAVVPGIGPGRLSALVRRFGSAERALSAPAAEIAGLPGFGPELVRRMRHAARPAGREPARAALEVLERHQAVALTPDDRDYPADFRLVADPPYLVFAVGDLGLLHRTGVAIVGTRRPSDYGRATATELSRQLVEAGYTIVSGMATGIDAAAHGAALAAGGASIGVLGNGIERIYPYENRPLFDAMRQRGLLITEFPPGEGPKAGNFPRRNRLIAALSRAVVVVEMAEKSGAQHTVNAALELDREVFAVPGPIGSQVSAGTNQLIKDGARVLTSVQDVVEALEGVGARLRAAVPPARHVAAVDAGAGARIAAPMSKVPGDLAPEEARLLSSLDAAPRHVDDLAAAAGLAAGKALAALLGLELRGLVESLPGKQFRRA